MDLRIIEDDLSGSATRELVRLHLQGMQDNSPPGTCFALDLSGLATPDVTVWSVWHGPRIAAIGALKVLANAGGELKSMRTHPDFLRQGIAAQLLEHIIGVARTRQMRRLSLETGTGPAFEPALALYRRRGFVNGAVFGDYVESPHNQYLHLTL